MKPQPYRLARAIRDLLSDGQPRARNDIAQQLGEDLGAIHKSLKRLERSGQITAQPQHPYRPYSSQNKRMYQLTE